MLCHGEPRTGTVPFPTSKLPPPDYFQTKIRRNFGIAKNLWRGGIRVRLEFGQGGELTGGAVAEEASALSIEILLSGEEPKFGPKTKFFEATPGGTRDRF